MLLRDIKNIFHKELDEIYPKEEVDSFFYSCVEHYLGHERFILVVQPNLTLTKDEEEPLFYALSELKKEKPLQYILGVAHFMGMDFSVNSHVLIPRPETEELVEWIVSEVTAMPEVSELKILDIGTGSGCIAIALAKRLPQAQITAIDVSIEALKVAEANAKSNNVSIKFKNQDVLDPDFNLDTKFHIIVSNPPYVRELEKESIKSNVKNFEPHLALFVKDEDPLLFYRVITNIARNSLLLKGQIYFEINQYLGTQTQALLEAANFSEIELRKDIFGNERMLKGCYQ